jgi:hypothetical protein
MRMPRAVVSSTYCICSRQRRRTDHLGTAATATALEVQQTWNYVIE